MTHASNRNEPISSSVYTREYFLSDACEGFDDYREGRVSAIKAVQLELLDVSPGMRVLDVGCGRGDVLAELGQRGIFAAGVDYAESAVALADELLGSEGRIVRADATALPLHPRTFDRVLMGDVIEHLPWDLAVAALREIATTLAPGGFILIHTSPNVWFSRWALPVARRILYVVGRRELSERITAYEDRKDAMHPNELSPVGLRRLVSEAGLSGRVWVSEDVLRSGSGPWTSQVARSRFVRVAARVAGIWPFRLLFGNDLFARVR